MAKVKVGDLIGVDGSRPFNHGCRDHAVLRVLAVRADTLDAVVDEATSCTSCWQVGHDRDHVFATVGDVNQYDITDLIEPDEDRWSTNIAWEIIP